MTYRVLWSEYAPKLSNDDPNANLIQIQAEWMDKLADFVQSYPKADDAPDADTPIPSSPIVNPVSSTIP